MKRQRGRNRKPGSGGSGGGGGGGGNNPNRAFESNGPENMKIRGNAQHVYERYQQLARDAFTSGDRVLAENYLQHAEHYFRVLRTLQPQRPVSEIAARDAFASGFDIDFEDESGAEAMGDEGQPSDGGEGDNGNRDNNNGDYRRDRDDYRSENREPRENREFNDARPQRDFGAPRDNASRDNASRDNAPRDNAPREGGEQREGGRREGRRERFERRRDRDNNQPAGANADPLAVIEPRGEQPQAETPREPDPRDEHLPAFLRPATAAPQAQSQPAAAPASPEATTEERPRRAPRRRRTEEESPSVEAAEEEA
ncbi:MAG TPA: DUF4167 domain-containing protein [Caulobacteraceae bacterium]|jgi:hypothetical protein|nr:DUF4167 domain-containing protein [Caulobacteraceae bacterium]